MPVFVVLMSTLAGNAAANQGPPPYYYAMWQPPMPWPGQYAPPLPGDGGAYYPVPEVQGQEAAATPQPATKRGKAAAKTRGLRSRGVASWYGKRFHGRKTASGTRYDMHAMTAAHRTLPLPSYVRVTNPANGKSVVVLVNDRGPYVGNRIIDLSYAAATALGFANKGIAQVELDVLSNPGKGRRGEALADAGEPSLKGAQIARSGD